MKLAKLLWDGEPSECILLENFQDVLEYQELVSTNTSNTFFEMVKRRIPMDRWDHYGFGAFGNSFNIAVQKAKIFGGRPVMIFDQVTNDKCACILKAIHGGKRVVVNRNGGWCTVMDDLHEILEVVDYVGGSDKKSVIKDSTTYLNLENDPELEKRTQEYLSEKDPNYSYVLGLREFSSSDLCNVFKEFLSKGGKIVYVYTTGSDIGQMWEYCKAMTAVGIKSVEFEFNAGIEQSHLEIIDYLRKNDISVEVIDTYEIT